MASLYVADRSALPATMGVYRMPDQSSAATEHAILQEITAPLETLPDDPVAPVHADFPVALRGYDRLAVDAYVQRTSQLVAELQATRSPEAAVRRALERVGEQISGILQRAHETAEQITAQSRSEAEDRLEQARAEAAEIAAAAAQRVRDLDADTDRIWIERHRIVDDARDLAPSCWPWPTPPPSASPSTRRPSPSSADRRPPETGRRRPCEPDADERARAPDELGSQSRPSSSRPEEDDRDGGIEAQTSADEPSRPEARTAAPARGARQHRRLRRARRSAGPAPAIPPASAGRQPAASE